MNKLPFNHSNSSLLMKRKYKKIKKIKNSSLIYVYNNNNTWLFQGRLKERKMLKILKQKKNMINLFPTSQYNNYNESFKYHFYGQFNGKMNKVIRRKRASVTCPSVNPPFKGQSSGQCVPGFPGRACRFNCIPGYSRQGENVINCGLNGAWSSPPPKCIAIPKQ